MNRIQQIEERYLRKDPLPPFDVGDTVKVEVRIKEGDKERLQPFIGVVIAKKHGMGVRGTFTVRRIVQGEGVERVFPYHSPKVASLTVTRRGIVRRAKLYYLRGRTGKRARIKERVLVSKKKKGGAAAPKQKVAAAAPKEPEPTPQG